MPQTLKSCPKCNRLPNLVILSQQQAPVDRPLVSLWGKGWSQKKIAECDKCICICLITNRQKSKNFNPSLHAFDSSFVLKIIRLIVQAHLANLLCFCSKLFFCWLGHLKMSFYYPTSLSRLLLKLDLKLFTKNFEAISLTSIKPFREYHR